MSQIAVPTPVETTSAPSRKGIWVAVPVVVVAALGGYWFVSRPATSGPSIVNGAYHTVAPMDLIVRVAKDGELQAVNNIDIINKVEGSTAIQTLVKEGESVKKGDILATLDSAALRQKIEDTTLELQKAEADLTTSKEFREIQLTTNSANLSAAEVEVQLAQLALTQYVDGTYPQQAKDAATTLEMAEITYKNAQDDLDQLRSLATKGFVTAADVKKGELAVTTARQNVDKAQTALTVLTKYTHEADLAAKKNAVAQGEQKLARVKRENASNLAQKTADVAAKSQALSILRRRMDRYQEQLAACEIKAPADGIIVYSSSSDRNSDQQIKEGATVRERQPLLRLPDTSSMKAVVRIQENQVTRLQPGMRAAVRIVGHPQQIGATLSNISVLADSSQRWWNPDLKEYPVELVLDHTPPGMKPGVGCSVEIFIDRLSEVAAVPVGAVYAAGSDNYVFVRNGQDVTPKKVTLGKASETHVQIADGLQPGADVLLLGSGQGRELLQRAGIKPPPVVAWNPDDPKSMRRGPGGPGGGEGGRWQGQGGGRPGGAEAAPGGNAPAVGAGAAVPAGNLPARPAAAPSAQTASVSTETATGNR